MSNYKFPVNRCSRCGYNWIAIKQRITGTGEYYVDLETGETDTQDLHDSLIYKNVNRYAVCAKCEKRLFKVNDGLIEFIDEEV